MSMPHRQVRGDASPARSATTSRVQNENHRSQQAKHPDEFPIHAHGAKGVDWDAPAQQPSALRHRRAKGTSRRILALSVAAIVLYGVAPAVLEVLGAYRRLTDVDPAWWIVVVAMSAAGTWCMCAVQRLTLNGARWFPVITSQLAGAAFSRVVPGGSAAAAALQARMLSQAGVPPAAVATGLTAGALLLLEALAGLPLLALPAVLLGGRIPNGLLQAAGIGLAVFVLLFAVGALLLENDQRPQGGGARNAGSRGEIASRPGAVRRIARAANQRAQSASQVVRTSVGPGAGPGRRALDLRLPVPVRRAPRSWRTAAAVCRAFGLRGRAVAGPAPAYPWRTRRGRSRAHGDAGARGRRRRAGGARHPRLPSCVILAPAAGWLDRLDLAPAPVRRGSSPGHAVRSLSNGPGV